MNNSLYIVAIFGIIVLLAVGMIVLFSMPNPFAHRSSETLKIEQEQTARTIQLVAFAKRWAWILCVFVPTGLALLFGMIKTYAIWNKSRMHTVQLGENLFPLHQPQIGMTPQLMQHYFQVQALRAINAGQAKAFETAGEILSLRHMSLPPNQLMIPGQEQLALSQASNFPSFRQLLDSGEFGPGRPLLFGYNEEGNQQQRDLQSIITMAVAGWQGSGKSFSIACLASQFALLGTETHLYDPHMYHKEGLSSLVKPLIDAKIINAWELLYLGEMLKYLSNRLDARIQGKEDSDQPIVIIIDEISRLSKSSHFDALIHFLERCTEETRKANIITLVCGQKWTAKNFKGYADIRACMPSMLIHKTKPSQADLLLEDSHDKKLVRSLNKPGEAILCTGYGDPIKTTMPFLMHQDLHRVVELIGNGRPVIHPMNIEEEIDVDAALCERFKRRCEEQPSFRQGVVKLYKLDNGYLSRCLQEKKLSPRFRMALQGALKS